MPTSSSSSSPISARPPSSHLRVNKLSISSLDKLSIVGSAVGDKIPGYIPGFKTSAAFLTSLSANLRIPDDALLPSPLSTPVMSAATDLSAADPPAQPLSPPTSAPSSASAAHPSTMASNDEDGAAAAQVQAAAAAYDPLAGVPEVHTYAAATADDRREALRLVADSVAQQRQFAARVLISHPANIAVFVACCAAMVQLISLRFRRPAELGVLCTTFAGIVMAALVAIRGAVGPYLAQAERVGWDWLGEDTVVVTKFGDELIGALVLGWDGAAEKGRGRKRKGGIGLVRAWTVKLRYRGRGEGKALLEEAVKLVKERGGDGVGFAENNVYSERVLPKFYNKSFERRDRRAQMSLDKVVERSGAFGRKR